MRSSRLINCLCQKIRASGSKQQLTLTNLQASNACSEFIKEAMVINVEDEDAINWLKTDLVSPADDHGFPIRW